MVRSAWVLLVCFLVFGPLCSFGYYVNDKLMSQQPELNWGQRVAFGAQYFRQPKTEQEIVEIVREVGARGGKIRMIGSGHSHTEVAVSADTMVNLDLYQGLLGVEGNLATFRAGTRIFNINKALKEVGLSLENLGWSAEFAFAGVMQIGTHGTNLKYGVIATTVQRFRLILANGTIVTASATENSDIYHARLNLGTLGIVSTVTIKAVPLFKLASFHNSTDYPTLIHQLETLPYTTQETHFVEWYWNAYHPDAPEGKYVTYWRPITDAPVTGCDRPDDYDGPEGCVDYSYNVLNEEDPFKYMEMEVFIPAEVSVQVLKDFNQYQKDIAATFNMSDPVTRTRFSSTFTGVRYVKGDDLWLSPAYGRDTAVISHFQYVNSPSDYPHFAMMINKLEEMTRVHKGRPHWGKLHFLSATELAPLYPHWNDFLQLRERLDPGNMFLNPYVGHLLYPHLPPQEQGPSGPTCPPSHNINLNFNGLLGM